MRHALRALGWAALVHAAGRADAQPCHEPVPLERRGIGLRVGLGAEYAAYRTARYEGDYTGASAAAQWDAPWARLRAALPAYRLDRNGLEVRGLGDLVLEGRVPFVRTEGDALAGGFVLAATLPTGDADRDLGMGHVMAMPGAWFSWIPARAFVTTQLIYGRALGAGAGGGHHGGGPRPIVNPMNASEVEASASAGYLIHELVRARAGVYGALPVDDRTGASRAAALVGADLIVDRFDLSLEGHLPLVGDPFLVKVVLATGVRF